MNSWEIRDYHQMKTECLYRQKTRGDSIKSLILEKIPNGVADPQPGHIFASMEHSCMQCWHGRNQDRLLGISFLTTTKSHLISMNTIRIQ